VSGLTIELRPREEQTAFNLRRWAELLADPEVRRIEGRIETDRHGRVVMSPPPDLGNRTCFVHCPEICVEVISPANTEEEIREKMALYFDAGAREVWICGMFGKMNFFGANSSPIERSALCPEFPQEID
jgi:hypothetical protein